MPTPLLSRLSASARVAYPFVRRAVQERMSFLDTQILLQEVGFPISKPDLLKIVNSIRREFKLGADLRDLPKNRVIAASRLHTAATKLRRQYSYDVLVRGIDTFSGRLRGQYVTVTSSRALTPAQIESQAERFAVGREGSGGMEEVNAELVSGRKAGSSGTF